MKIFFNFSALLLTFGLLISSCTKKVEFETKNYKKTLPVYRKTEFNDVGIDLKILEAKDKSEVSDSINATILKTVSSVIYLGENPKKVANYEALTTAFVDAFVAADKEAMIQNLSEHEFAWYATITTQNSYQSDNLLNIVINHDGFNGGAHPYSGIQSLVFDPKTGEIIPKNKLFSDLKKVTELVETKFRENQKIDKTVSLEKDYFFERGIFRLSENILFTEKEITFHYNQYEAASYAQGPIDIVIPFEQIAPFLLVK
jgi:hypothetical protein